jgi:hypothetical protein
MNGPGTRLICLFKASEARRAADMPKCYLWSDQIFRHGENRTKAIGGFEGAEIVRRDPLEIVKFVI